MVQYQENLVFPPLRGKTDKYKVLILYTTKEVLLKKFYLGIPLNTWGLRESHPYDLMYQKKS
jgi:hypothetical protein